MATSKESDQAACAVRRYDVTEADLPLSCPLIEERIWDAHPRIYLPIEEAGKVVCPYCGTLYVLKKAVPSESS